MEKEKGCGQKCLFFPDCSNNRCPFFETSCGVATIRQYYRRENWHCRFCFADFEKCPHYQSRTEKKL